MPNDPVKEILERLVSSPGFSGSEKLCTFLRFIVAQSLAGRTEQIKESVIGTEVYGRKPGYDTKTDAIVRVEAGRLRARLKLYYEGPGRSETLRIDLPKGTYVPVFQGIAEARRVKQTVPRRHSSLWLPKRWGAAALLLAAMAGVSFGIYRAAPRDQSLLSIAVLPFKNLNEEAGVTAFSAGLTQHLTHALSMEPGVLVSSRTSAAQFQDQPLDISAVGRRLHVQAILEGSAQRKAERIRVTAHLVSTADGYQLWSEDYEAPAADAVKFEDAVSELIARTLRANFAGSRVELRRPHAERDPEAVQLYMQGHAEWLTQSLEGTRRAGSSFEQAVGRDSAYAEAYAGLGKARLLEASLEPRNESATVGQAKVALARALALDDRLAEAHAALGNILLFHEWNFGAAEHELKRALELKPGVDSWSRWYALVASLRGHQEMARQELEYAELASPDSEVIKAELGRIALELGHPQAAETYARRSLAIGENYPPARFLLGLISERQRNHHQAIAEYRKCAAASPTWGLACNAAVAHALIASGDRAGAGDILPTLRGQTSLALVALAMGDPEGAHAALERAIGAREVDFLQVKNDARFDPLRPDPRFNALLLRAGM